MKHKSWVYPALAALLPALGLVAGGCLKSGVVVRVDKDGKGQIVVSQVFPKETADTMATQMTAMRMQMRMMARGGAAAAPEKDADPFYNEKMFKAQAKQFGPGVRFVKAKKFDYAGARGSVALYAFNDVNEVYLDMEKMGNMFQHRMMGMMDTPGSDGEEGGRMEKSEKSIEFKMNKAAPGKLQIFVPALSDSTEEEAETETEENADEPEKKEGEDTADEAQEDYMENMMMSPAYFMQYAAYGHSMFPAMFTGVGNQKEAMRRMYRGMRMSLAVEVDGTIASTTSKHVDAVKKNRVMLLDIDADKIMDSPKGPDLMGKFGDGMSGRMPAMMKGVPGVLVETNREITVEFK